jgi:signal peptidase II
LQEGVKLLAAIALPLYALDQATKWWIYHSYALIPTTENVRRFPDVVEKGMSLPEVWPVIPDWFHIVHWANTGAAFSMGSGNNGFFIAISIVAFVGLLIAWKKNVFPDRLSQVAVALIISGIMGNVTDRLIHGYVVDFILVNLHVKFANPWPAFNVADSCIFIAAALFIIAGIKDARKPKTQVPEKQERQG